MNRWIKSIIILSLIVFLSGCYNTEIKFNPDGSGEIKYILPKDSSSESPSFSISKAGMEKYLAEVNKKAGKAVVKLLYFNENKNAIETAFSFQTINSFGESNPFFGTIKDYTKKHSDAIKLFKDRNGNPLPLNRINKNLMIVHYEDLGNLKITVPGNILYASENAEFLSDNLVQVSSGGLTVVFEKYNPYLWIIYLLVVIVICLAGFLLVRKNQARKKADQSESLLLESTDFE